MKLIPKTQEEIRKDKVTLYRNALKAGLAHVGGDIFSDESVYPTEYYRFCYPKKVSDIKEAINIRNLGNKELYAVHMHDFENLIPSNVLSVLVNRRTEALLKRRVKEEMKNAGLSTETPENVYSINRDKTNEYDSYASFDDYVETRFDETMFKQ